MLREFLANERVVLVEGIGGIGKTQLVLETLQDFQEKPLVWVDVESYRNLRDLKLALLTSVIQENRESMASTSIFDLLNKRPLLIILDGLDRIQSYDSDNTIDFLNELVTLTSEPTFVITSQIELRLNCRFSKIVVPALSESESREVLRIGCENHHNICALEDDIKWLISFAQGHTLCLHIIVGLLRYYKNSEYVVEQIRLAGSEALKDPTRETQNRSTSLNACLTAAYECLSHEQKRLLQYVSNFPAGCMEHRVRNWQSNEYALNVAELQRLFFIEIRHDEILGINRLFLLNPVKQFIRQQWKKQAYREAAEIQLEVAKSVMMEVSFLDYKYFETSTEVRDLQYGLIRVSLEFSNFIQALRYAEWLAERRESAEKNTDECLDIIAGITFALSKYLFISGLLKEGIYIIEPGIIALERLKRFREAATQCVMVANMRARIHDYAGEVETTERLVSLSNRTSDPRIIALAALALGGINQRARRLSEAAEYFRTAIDYFRKPAADDDDVDDERYYTGMFGMSLKCLGEIYEAWNKPQDALQYHLEALECVKSIGDHTNLGSIYHQLGNCYAELGQTDKSVWAYRQALTSFLQVGYSQFISNAMGEMGKVVADAKIFDAEMDKFLTGEVVSAGLNDIAADVNLLISTPQRTIEDDVMMLSKLFGIVKLISFSSNARMLHEWAQEFETDIVKPVLLKGSEQNNLQQELFIECLSLTINLAKLIGELSVSDEGYSQRYVNRLRRHCELMSTVWRSSRSNEWLAALLRYHCGYTVT